ncbi:MAG: hypothetical protein MK212_01675 [Saprospiraceae bacterium]|nr:hypothetical protein [Saprospiraceae bacterium]
MAKGERRNILNAESPYLDLNPRLIFFSLLSLFLGFVSNIALGQSDSLTTALGDSTREVRTYWDLQIHPTMHKVYSFFGEGLQYFDPKSPPKLRYKHQLKNVNYANYLRKNKGARIIVNGSLTNEDIKSKKKARRMILEQMSFVNRFAAQDSNFVVAKTPKEVRYYVHNTDKTIIVHSINSSLIF